MKEYLGDGVYAETLFCGNTIKLTTENGLPSDPSNTIYLEHEVLKALIQFAKRAMDERGKANADS